MILFLKIKNFAIISLTCLVQVTKANDADSDPSGESDNDEDTFESETYLLKLSDSTNDESDDETNVEVSFDFSNGEPQTSGQPLEIDKTSESSVIWEKINDGDETKIRKRISFNENEFNEGFFKPCRAFKVK